MFDQETKARNQAQHGSTEGCNVVKTVRILLDETRIGQTVQIARTLLDRTFQDLCEGCKSLLS